jgi:hypothetical protein
VVGSLLAMTVNSGCGNCQGAGGGNGHGGRQKKGATKGSKIKVARQSLEFVILCRLVPLKSVNVFKTMNYVNYEFSGERWIAGSDLRVPFGDVDINTICRT